MSFLGRLKAQVNPFDNGATFSNPNPQLPLYRGNLSVPSAGPGTQLQSGPGVQYNQPPNQSLNQPGLAPGLTPQTSPGLAYQQPFPDLSQVGQSAQLQLGQANGQGQPPLPQGGQFNPGYSPLQGTHSFLPASFYTRRR